MENKEKLEMVIKEKKLINSQIYRLQEKLNILTLQEIDLRDKIKNNLQK